MKNILDTEAYRFLLVEPDEECAREMQTVFSRLGLPADHCASHLKAVALTEDTTYHGLFVAAHGPDISGPELCAMVRAREARRQGPPLYLVMTGAAGDLVTMLSSGENMDDYLVGAWMDLELEWKIRRAVRALDQLWRKHSGQLVDPGTGLLTQAGLRAFLFEEVNRVGRRHGWFSLTVLWMPDHAGLRVSYGQEWMEWFKSGIWAYLRRQLRNYDRLAALGNGFLCLISPDLDEIGTRALISRLESALDEYRFQDRSEDDFRIALAARYLCVQVLGNYKQFDRSSEVLWEWMEEQLRFPMTEGVQGYVGSVALALDVAPR